MKNTQAIDRRIANQWQVYRNRRDQGWYYGAELTMIEIDRLTKKLADLSKFHRGCIKAHVKLKKVLSN